MGYEIYARRGDPKKLLVTIVPKHSRLMFNQHVTAIFAGAPMVRLLWDVKTRRIGIEPVAHDFYGFIVCRFGNQRGVRADKFLRYIGVTHLTSRRYVAIWNDAKRLLEIPLDPAQPARPPRDEGET